MTQLARLTASDVPLPARNRRTWLIGHNEEFECLERSGSVQRLGESSDLIGDDLRDSPRQQVPAFTNEHEAGLGYSIAQRVGGGDRNHLVRGVGDDNGRRKDLRKARVQLVEAAYEFALL